MGVCSAFGCPNRTDRNRKPGVTFHKFPRQKGLRDQWVKAVRRLNWVPGVNSYLCSEHFSHELLNRTSACGRTELRENAVPTLFPSYPKYLQPSVKKIRKPPRSRAVEPTPSTSAEPLPPTPSVPESIDIDSSSDEEPLEINGAFSKEVAVQVSEDSVMNELVNRNKHLEWKIGVFKNMLQEKSIALKQVKKQNLGLDLRISYLEVVIKELWSKNLPNEKCIAI